MTHKECFIIIGSNWNTSCLIINSLQVIIVDGIESIDRKCMEHECEGEESQNLKNDDGDELEFRIIAVGWNNSLEDSKKVIVDSSSFDGQEFDSKKG